MTILLHKPYIEIVTSDHEGGKRGQKYPKNLTTWFMDDPLRWLFWGIQGQFLWSIDSFHFFEHVPSVEGGMKNFFFLCASLAHAHIGYIGWNS